MEFGRVEPKEISTINFKLPADTAFTEKVLSKSAAKKPKVFVGCAKWGRKDWVGKLYPKGTKDANFLEHYARHFSCIEFNAMFYQIFPVKTIEGWVSKVGKDFKFCPKFNNSITHIKRLKNAEAATDNFLQAINAFGKNLGPCFLQLSDNYGPKEFEYMELYLTTLPKDVEVFVEVRHKDWYLPENSERLFSMLAKRKFGTVITDSSGRRDCTHMTLTVPKSFIRFVGNALHKTDYERIDDWVKRIKKWLDQGIKEVYFFMHQHDELHSPELCLYTIRELNKKCKLEIPEPKFVNQKGLFD